jgi:hypothetical protein
LGGENRWISAGAAARAGARGVIGAMAMSGLRQATTSLGLVEQTPPEQALKHTAPNLFYRVPVNRRPALVELIHWSYGAAGGVLFGMLPRWLRRRTWVGPAYGFAFWTVFEAAIAPVLGVDRGRQGLREQLALLIDHTLYGVVVGASPWPHAD